jgi:NAD(P)-dependent dehydrogenase (short-subunit alcohol dehydrogenase family)
VAGDKPLQGKMALVTGASKGIGKGISVALARAGCEVGVNYFSDTQGAEQTASEIRALGRKTAVYKGDVADRAEVEEMFRRYSADFPRLDILVNNAGITLWGPLLEMSDEKWDRILGTNLKGAFLCTQQAGRIMRNQKKGRIINIGSGAGRTPFPNLSAYNASKAGLNLFTATCAVELGPLGITVNCVAPGAVEVERTKLEADDYAGTWAPLTPTRRVGRPADVASAVLFLAGDEAEFITGQVLYVDGGLWTQGPWPYNDEKQ